MAVGASQASSHFPLEPLPASILAECEAARRNATRAQGPCRSGCRELDEYVLMGGGLERGSVVGVSAEDEDAFGLALGLQVVIRALLNDERERALVVTPKPAGVLLAALRDGIRAELASGAAAERAEDEKRARACLDRVMLSCVFDLDGVWEALAELDQPNCRSPSPSSSAPPGATGTTWAARRADVTTRPEAGAGTKRRRTASPASSSSSLSPPPPSSWPRAPRVPSEIGDSQDDDEALTPPPATPPDARAEADVAQQQQPQEQPQQHDEQQQQQLDKSTRGGGGGSPQAQLPSIILITHLSSLLTGLFAQREKSAAHAALQLLGAHLRHLSRSLPSNPLILLLNSTAADNATAHHHAGAGRDSLTRPLDPSLRSVFAPPALPLPGYAAPPAPRRAKPAFGLIFSQLLDLHLLCTRVPLSAEEDEGTRTDMGGRGYVTVVEVLLDEMGVWQGGRGPRPRREQRWAPLQVVRGRVVDATAVGGSALAALRGDGLRLPGGFGGRRA